MNFEPFISGSICRIWVRKFYTDISVVYPSIIDICVLREARWVPLTPQCAVMHFIYIIYVIARFIAKSNAFCHFYRKIQCVRKRLHIYSMSSFLANLMCFVTTYLKTIVRTRLLGPTGDSGAGARSGFYFKMPVLVSFTLICMSILVVIYI